MAEREGHFGGIPCRSRARSSYRAGQERPARRRRPRPWVFPVLSILTMLGGALMAAALSSPHAAWCAWVGLVPLFAAIRMLSPRQAAFAGATWGFPVLVLLFNSRHGGLTDPGVLSLLMLLAVPACYASTASRLTRRIGYSPFILAAGWIGVEFALRPLGLRHGLLAGTDADGVLLGSIGRFLGYVFVAFVVVWFNASLLAIFIKIRVVWPRQIRRQDRTTPVLQGCLSPQTCGCFSTFTTPTACPRGPPISVVFMI